MAFGYLNERTRTILSMILRRTTPISIREIAGELSLSTRTIYNEIDKVTDYLKTEKLPPLEVVRGKVQPFSAENREKIESVLEEGAQRDDYIFTPTERIRIIVCRIISSTDRVLVEDLMDSCLVSRNTIFTDLQAVITQLHTYSLELAYEKSTGYRIDGDGIRVRAIFFLYFHMLEPLYQAGRLSFLTSDTVDPYLEKLELIEEALDVHYVRTDLCALASMIPVMEKGSTGLILPDMDRDKIASSKEYHLVKEEFPSLSEEESIYLALHFLGGRLTSYSSSGPGRKTDESTWEIAKNLVAEFERRACVIFDRKEELTHNLYLHIKSSIYRYRYGIQIGNPMEDDVEREYPDLFDVTRATAGYLEQQIGVQISDSEVAYLALHFGSHLEFAREEERDLRILVVCMNGIATGNMISHELSRILPRAKIAGVAAASDVVNPQLICDLIVSSVKIKSVVPVIVVNPILNDFDRRNILSHPLVRGKYGYVDVDALFRMLQKYVKEDRHGDLRRDLDAFFAHEREEKQVTMSPAVWRLRDFLSEDRILLLKENEAPEGRPLKSGDLSIRDVPDAEDPQKIWTGALFRTAAPLLARGSISDRYVPHIIERLIDAGPYMFVSEDLILAHARPENGVKHLDLAIGVAPEGIPFGGGKTARVVIVLAAEDQQKHMGVLRDIRKVFRKKENIEALVCANTAQEVLGTLRAMTE